MEVSGSMIDIDWFAETLEMVKVESELPYRDLFRYKSAFVEREGKTMLSFRQSLVPTMALDTPVFKCTNQS